ncbi:MAG: DUF6152 family protein [Candidatus Rariloculaceae bacterium]
MRTRIIIASALLLAVASAPLFAHHSISLDYLRNQDVTLRGVVVEVILRNPHSEISVHVVNDSGETELWTLELDDAGELSELGIVDGTLQAGDELVIDGNPARDGSNGLFIQRFHRPFDGLEYEDD